MRDRNIRKTSLFLIFLSPIFLSNTPEAAWSFASNSVVAYLQLLDWISRQTGKVSGTVVRFGPDKTGRSRGFPRGGGRVWDDGWVTRTARVIAAVCKPRGC